MSVPEKPSESITLVVPCYDEAARLNVSAFAAFVAENANARLLFVNDGSRDGTLAVLQRIQSEGGGQIDVLDLERNVGKAEAVRRGMLRALEHGDELVGFWDADLATPLGACWSLVGLLRARPHLEVVIGSRVLLLGRTIERHALRHYVGRIVATAASLTLDLPVYDTQCGAKIFRAGPRLASALAEPFVSTWVFDVELIARYGMLPTGYSPAGPREFICEFPLVEWHDVAGSKVRWLDFGRALMDLARIRRKYTRVRASVLG